MIQLTVKEAAAIARRHEKRIRNAVEARELPGVQLVPRGRWLIREKCLEAYIEGALCPHANLTPVR